MVKKPLRMSRNSFIQLCNIYRLCQVWWPVGENSQLPQVQDSSCNPRMEIFYPGRISSKARATAKHFQARLEEGKGAVDR